MSELQSLQAVQDLLTRHGERAGKLALNRCRVQESALTDPAAAAELAERIACSVSEGLMAELVTILETWDESEHPRDRGKFSSKPGEPGSPSESGKNSGPGADFDAEQFAGAIDDLTDASANASTMQEARNKLAALTKGQAKSLEKHWRSLHGRDAITVPQMIDSLNQSIGPNDQAVITNDAPKELSTKDHTASDASALQKGQRVKVDGHEGVVLTVRSQVRSEPLYHPTDPNSLQSGERKTRLTTVRLQNDWGQRHTHTFREVVSETTPWTAESYGRAVPVGQLRVLESGTSEGAEKGWETRRHGEFKSSSTWRNESGVAIRVGHANDIYLDGRPQLNSGKTMGAVAAVIRKHGGPEIDVVYSLSHGLSEKTLVRRIQSIADQTGYDMGEPVQQVYRNRPERNGFVVTLRKRSAEATAKDPGPTTETAKKRGMAAWYATGDAKQKDTIENHAVAALAHRTAARDHAQAAAERRVAGDFGIANYHELEVLKHAAQAEEHQEVVKKPPMDDRPDPSVSALDYSTRAALLDEATDKREYDRQRMNGSDYRLNVVPQEGETMEQARARLLRTVDDKIASDRAEAKKLREWSKIRTKQDWYANKTGESDATAGGNVLESADFDPDEHPRNDHGQFVSKGMLDAARKNPWEADKLRAQVTKPEERAKLDAAIGPPPEPGSATALAVDQLNDMQRTHQERYTRDSDKAYDEIARKYSNPETYQLKPDVAPTDAEYHQAAQANLLKISRTAKGQVDVSASKGKADKLAVGSGQEAADLANRNFQDTITQLYVDRDRQFASTDEVTQFVDDVNRSINRGITKEGVLLRTDDSPKYPYTEASKLEHAREEFASEFIARVDYGDPIETAAWVHWRLNMTDHSYADGVGKTSEALADWVLMRHGFPLPEIDSRESWFAHANRDQANPDDMASYYQEGYQKWQEYYRSLFKSPSGAAPAEPPVAPAEPPAAEPPADKPADKPKWDFSPRKPLERKPSAGYGVKGGWPWKEPALTHEQIDAKYPPLKPDGEDSRARYKTAPEGNYDKGVYTPEVEARHQEIIEEHFEKPTPVPENEQPLYIFLGGGTAAGKSTALRSGKIDMPTNRVHIDVDDIKDRLFHFQRDCEDLKDSAASFAHEESSDVGKQVNERALAGRYNVIMDGTGDTTFKGVKKKVEKARAAGHKVVAHYMTNDLEKAFSNSDNRGTVPPYRKVEDPIIVSIHASVSQIVPELLKEGVFDEFDLWDTTGKDPVLLVTAKGKDVTIHDQDGYNKFVAKGEAFREFMRQHPEAKTDR